jgi:predicted O-methyltransferase YrrM
MPNPQLHLDSLSPLDSRVGYGQLGVSGALGYEGKQVSAQGRPYPHALSTHAPARLIYRVDGRFGQFQCQVAINDDVPPCSSSADFTVLADGRPVAAALGVVAGDLPRRICAELGSAHILELAVDTGHWDHCHTVWLDPVLCEGPPRAAASALADCLERANILVPSEMPRAAQCIATVASQGFEALLDDMLGSLLANGGCQDALLVVFCVGDPSTIAPIAAKYRAALIHCTPARPIGMSLKSILYSAARVVDADRFLCLDADVLVLGDLRPLFAMVEASPDGAVLACREENSRAYRHLGDAFKRLYHGNADEAGRLLGERVAAYPLVVNDGVFAGSRAALLALDSAVRAMPELRAWMDGRPDIAWRNQFLFNAALAESACGAELNPIYNLQLNRRNVRMFREGGRPRAEWKGKRVAVVHFNGDGRRKQAEWHGIYSRPGSALAAASGGASGSASGGDGYARFLEALRAWAGVHGMDALAWSFYGTSDGAHARVSDAGTMPLLALLHYLIRSNGCVRVMETGTARGISSACMASAVAHRGGARVVSFDPHQYPQRDELWAALPEEMRSCLEARLVGSLDGMAAAIAGHESYQAALLDSIHTSEHVWAEFELARQLVCPGGLILVHDARCAAGTVAAALERIQAAGYGVARLWTAESGVREDSGLGLAVIENRVYPCGA